MVWTVLLLALSTWAQTPPKPNKPPSSKPNNDATMWGTQGPKWQYHMDTNGESSFSNSYTFIEMFPRSAMLCPQGYFLAELRYNFSKPEPGKGETLKLGPELTNSFDTTILRVQDGLRAFLGTTRTQTGQRHLLSVIEDNESDKKHDEIYGLGFGANGAPPKRNMAQYMQNFQEERKPKKHPHQFPPKPKGQGQKRKASGLDPSILFWPGRGSKLGACPTLVHCLGYQACLFHFGNKFCQNDPAPGYRKGLHVTIKCEKDETFKKIYDHVDKSLTLSERKQMDVKRNAPDYTVFIRYNEVDNSYGAPLLMPNRTLVHQDEVFENVCPALRDTTKYGYHGECVNKPRNKTETTKATWRILARESDITSRSELFQVFCSYEYNRKGGCIPPFALKDGSPTEDDPVSWSHSSMPQHGRRYDLTTYYTIYRHPHMGLIPTRLAFFITAFENTGVIMQLIGQIYRSYHFFVVHIDSAKPHLRNDLEDAIKHTYQSASNIMVLASERSFRSSWGSWYIMRAQLEALEEILRMGVWDFAINLSGGGLAIRNIDDLAVMLAPYRGRTVFRVNGEIDQENDIPMTKSWHSCNGHVYEVTGRNLSTISGKLWSHSQFGLFSRDFIEYLLQGEAVVDKWHYLLNTAFIPDEMYFGTILFNSPFKDTHIRYISTYMKPFVGETSENLCRHAEETDACGRGPSIFDKQDTHLLMLNAHHHFFARKFPTEPDNVLRQRILKMTEDDTYAREMSKIIPKSLIRHFAEISLNKIKERGEINNEWSTIDHSTIKIVPKLQPSDPCCQPVADTGIQLTDEFSFILDFDAVHIDGRKLSLRSALGAHTTYSHTCYPEGHIRMIHLTSRRDSSVPPARQAQKPEQLKFNLPLPINPQGGDILFLDIYLDITDIPKDCAARASESNLGNQRYAEWDIEQIKNTQVPPPKLSFDISLVDPSGEVTFKVRREFDTGHVGRPHPEHQGKTPPQFNIWTTPMPLDPTKDGIWTVTVKQRDVEKPFSYCQNIMILNETSKATFDREDVRKLWSVEDVMVLEDEGEYSQYYRPVIRQLPRKSTSSQPKAYITTKTFQYDNKDVKTRCRQAEVASHNFRNPFEVLFYVSFALLMLGAIFIYNFCRYRTCRRSCRRTCLNSKYFVFIFVLTFIQFIYYELTRPSSLSFHDQDAL